MKMRVWEIVVLSILAVVAVASALLRKVWDGFSYVSSVAFVLFMGFFLYNKIYNLKLMKKQYDEGLETYFVELYNNGLITKDQLEHGDPRIVKGYYKDYRQKRSLTTLLLVLLAVLIIGIIVTLVGLWYNF